MKKFNSSKNIIIALSILIVVVLIVTFTTAQRNEKKQSLPGQSTVNNIVASIDNALFSPLRGIENGVKSINNLFSTYTENDRLKKRIDENAALHSELQTYKKENDELKKQLEINDTLANFDRVSANVINRSPDNWQDIIVIDKGESDGVAVNMPVMGSKGLVGRVLIVESDTAKVELLTTANENTNHFPVMLETESGDAVYGLITGYDTKKGALIVSQLTKTDGLKEKGDVATSGLGNNSPKGLYIGEIMEVNVNKDVIDSEVLVKPVSNMYDISFVTVIQRLAGSGS